MAVLSKDLFNFITIEKMHNNKKFTVTNNIRKLRFNNNEMTQAQLAELTGASRQTIIAIEAGKYLPSLELAFRIAVAFNVTIGEVFSFEMMKEA